MTKYYFTALSVVAALAVCLGATGCGSSSSANETLTKTTYLKKADIICEKASREQGELAAAYIKRHPGAEEKDFAGSAGIPPLEKQLKELKALGIPSEDHDVLSMYLKQFAKDLSVAKEEPLRMLSERDNPFAKTINLGRKYGFVDCRVLP